MSVKQEILFYLGSQGRVHSKAEEMLLKLIGRDGKRVLLRSLDARWDAGVEEQDLFSIIEQYTKGTNRQMHHGDIALQTTHSAIQVWTRSGSGTVHVPYTISSDYTAEDQAVFSEAMQEYATLTCIRFVNRTNEFNYINIISDTGCYSYLGRVGGAQDLSLQRSGCVITGIIQHELNHALGFEHEQCRSDRDNFVHIYWENIADGYQSNFFISDLDTLGAEYDYSSVMHYGKFAFTTNYLKATIKPIPNEFIPIGQRYGLSNLDVAKINKLYNCSVCSTLLSEFNGSFVSANYPSQYPNNANCVWLLRIPREKVLLQFDAFDVQTSPGCVSDYIRVYDGDSQSSPVLLDRACGTQMLPLLIASANKMLVQFVTDVSIPASGFKVSYSSVTCGGTLTTARGNVSSPGSPYYPPLSDCTWTINAPLQYKVLLNFTSFSLEMSSGCDYDYVIVRDGGRLTSRSLGKFCGTTAIPTLVSSGSALLLQFHSDGSQEYMGFLAHYSVIAASDMA
ncbi:embryonic protein UVS.2-like [Rhinatrema bivittatum]|uniref:embryonic protein UVS.2-like n=1 Tax=Rhinatrema bivittatum TaxID=194408 RepID=UPI00112BAD4F|nr:embryonic protein UVS.2-like [Rhinatrema bivittatum]